MTTPRVHRVQVAGAVADGAALTIVVLYFTQVVGLPEQAVGLVLAAAAAAAALVATPLGVWTDRVGLGRAAGCFSLAVAAALAAYAFAGSLEVYAAAGVLFGIARAALGAAIQALVAERTPPADRVRARARLHALLNGGFGCGAVVGAGVLVAGRPALFVAVFVGGAATAVACSVVLFSLPASSRGATSRPGMGRGALRDPRFVGVVALTSVLMLTIPMLSVLLPLWIARSAAPVWVAAVAFALNTVLVFTLQTRWSGRVHSDRDATHSALAAGAAVALASVLYAVVPALAATGAVLAVLGGVVAMTIGEVTTGPAAWHLALRDVPADRQGEYQAAFGMSFSIARVLGPLLALPLVTAYGGAGWVLIGGAVLVAGVGLAAIGRRPAPGRVRLDGLGPQPLVASEG